MGRILTRYFRASLLHYLLNPYLWFWAVAFMSFWAAMSAFVFSKNVPQEYMSYHFASTFGQLLILCVGSIGISIVGGLYYASFSVRYVTKFSKLSPKRFYVEHFLSTISALLIFSLILWLIQLFFYYIKFDEIYLPERPLGLALALLLSVCFIYVFSVFLAYLTIWLRKPAISTFVSYVPLMLGFVAYAGFWVDFKEFSLLLPFYLISAITYYFYVDQKPFTGNIIGNMIYQLTYGHAKEGALLEPSLAIASIVVWIIILSAICVILIRKARGISIEELQL